MARISLIVILLLRYPGKFLEDMRILYTLLPTGGLAGLVFQSQEPLQISDLDPEQQQWFSRGAMREVLGHQMFSLRQGHSNETVVLIHGFPSSSFDFYSVVDKESASIKVHV